MEELNKKIAEWCGFKTVTHTTKRGYFWRYPSGQLRPDMPKFDISLNACFEYVAPNVFKEFGVLALEELLDRWVEDIMRGMASHNPQKPALALCRAVERLIDNKKEITNGTP